MTPVLVAKWADPVELDAWRVLDDPLGIRAAANALAASMFSPVTARTTSIRQLGITMLCAHWVASGHGTIDRGQLAGAIRTVTVSLSSPDLEVARAAHLSPLSGLPGRTRAANLARASERGSEVDLTAPLLKNELSAGLWGRYATMARQLGFLERRGASDVITKDGRSLADATRRVVFPHKATFTGVNLKTLRELTAKAVESSSDTSRWPVTDDERRMFLAGVRRAGAGPRISHSVELAHTTPGQLLPAIAADPDLAGIRGTSGDPVSILAELAMLADELVEVVEDPFRARLRGDRAATPSVAGARRFDALLVWAKRRDLELGRLGAGDLCSWAALERHHERVFRRRGRHPWTSLPDERRPLEVPARATPLDLRLGAVVSLAQEVLG